MNQLREKTLEFEFSKKSSLMKIKLRILFFKMKIHFLI